MSYGSEAWGREIAQLNAEDEREIQRLVAQQGRVDPQLLIELRREVPEQTIAAISTAQQQLMRARSALQAARQPLGTAAPSGSAQERALARLTHEEEIRDAQAAFDRANDAAQQAQRAYESAQRQAWHRRVSAQTALVERLRAEAPRLREAEDRRHHEARAAIEQPLNAAEQALAWLTRVTL